MVEVKGKFIMVTAGLISPYRHAFGAAAGVIFRRTGKR